MGRTAHRRRTATATAAVALAVLTSASGCESNPEPEPPLPEDAGEVVQVEPEETAETEETEETEGGGGPSTGAELAARMQDGVGKRGSASVRMRVTGPEVLQIQGVTTYGPDSASDLRISSPDLGGAAARMILVEDEVFVSLPGATQKGTYFRIPTGNRAFSSLVDAGESVGLDDLTDGFEQGVTDVTAQGTRTVDGADFDVFVARVDPAAFDDALGETAEVAAFDMELLVDEEYRPRRISYEVEDVGVVLDLTDWGKPVAIDPPKAGDVVRLPPQLR